MGRPKVHPTIARLNELADFAASLPVDLLDALGPGVNGLADYVNKAAHAKAFLENGKIQIDLRKLVGAALKYTLKGKK